MGKIKNPKIFYKNLIFLVIFVIAISLMVKGYLLLYTDDVEVAKHIIKKGWAKIETVSGREYEIKIDGLQDIDGEIYILSKSEKVSLKDILYINDEDVNKKIIKEISDRAIKGMFMVISGGFLVLFLILIRNYV
ncbi:hypothetical protein [Persephonella sp.]